MQPDMSPEQPHIYKAGSCDERQEFKMRAGVPEEFAEPRVRRESLPPEAELRLKLRGDLTGLTGRSEMFRCRFSV